MQKEEIIMKRFFTLLAALCMLAALPAYAENPVEEFIYEVTYEGVETLLPETEWLITVPADWTVTPHDFEPMVTIGNEFSINISCLIRPTTHEEIYASLSRGVNFKEEFISYKTINGFSCMSYSGGSLVEYIDLGDGNMAQFEIMLVKPFLPNYDEVESMVYQMIGSLHLPEQE